MVKLRGLVFGACVCLAPLAANAQSYYYVGANHGAGAYSTTDATGAGLAVKGSETSEALAQGTSFGTTLGRTALTGSTSYGAGTAFGAGLGVYGYGATAGGTAYQNFDRILYLSGGAP
jgi:hypothetical protein